MNTDVQKIKHHTKRKGNITQSQYRLPVLFLIMFGFSLFSSTSIAANVMLIGDIKQSVHQQLIHELTKRLSEEPNSLEVRHPDQVTESLAAKVDLIITLGLSAAKSADLLKSNTPIYFALLPKTLAEKFTNCLVTPCPQKRGALFLDQPIERQLNLIKIIFPDLESLSFLYGDFSAFAASELNERAKLAGYKVISAHITSSEQLSRKLNDLLQRSELLVTLPDPLINNRHSIPQILLSSYRYSVPVIGFSKSYVSAGAIAAVFSSIEDLSEELIQRVHTFEKNGQLPTTGGDYPSLYRVQINRDVARSMSLRISSPELLHKGLLALENRP